MLKEVRKEYLMRVDYLGLSVIIETDVGGIIERYGGVLHGQTFAGDAEMVRIVMGASVVSVGVSIIVRAWICRPEPMAVCPDCQKVRILDQWVVLNIPDGSPIAMVRQHCPECLGPSENA